MALLLLALAALTSPLAAPASPPQPHPHAPAVGARGSRRWSQGKTFVITGWEGPEASPGPGWAQRWDAIVSEMAQANFTVLMGGSSSGRQPTPTLNQSTIQAEDLRTTLSIAEKNGMRVILAPDAEAFDPTTALGAKNGTVMGYGPVPGCSEESADEFGACVNASQLVAARRPGALRFGFLLPTYACVPDRCQKGFRAADNYTDYVTRYMREVEPDVLIVDIYPFFESEDDAGPASRAGYRANLEELRRASLDSGVAFWTMFNT